jgi:hypothetical protein
VPGQQPWPWTSQHDHADSLVLRRRVLTLMAVGLLVAGGLLLGLSSVAWGPAWWAFAAGSCWVYEVRFATGPGHWPPPGGAGVREPREPLPGPPSASVAGPVRLPTPDLEPGRGQER